MDVCPTPAARFGANLAIYGDALSTKDLHSAARNVLRLPTVTLGSALRSLPAKQSEIVTTYPIVEGFLFDFGSPQLSDHRDLEIVYLLHARGSVSTLFRHDDEAVKRRMVDGMEVWTWPEINEVGSYHLEFFAVDLPSHGLVVLGTNLKKVIALSKGGCSDDSHKSPLSAPLWIAKSSGEGVQSFGVREPHSASLMSMSLDTADNNISVNLTCSDQRCKDALFGPGEEQFVTATNAGYAAKIPLAYSSLQFWLKLLGAFGFKVDV